jgi:hypothetical protein
MAAFRVSEPAAPLHSHRPALRSGNQVSSLPKIKWCDQSGVEFSAKCAPSIVKQQKMMTILSGFEKFLKLRAVTPLQISNRGGGAGGGQHPA